MCVCADAEQSGRVNAIQKCSHVSQGKWTFKWCVHEAHCTLHSHIVHSYDTSVSTDGETRALHPCMVKSESVCRRARASVCECVSVCDTDRRVGRRMSRLLSSCRLFIGLSFSLFLLLLLLSSPPPTTATSPLSSPPCASFIHSHSPPLLPSFHHPLLIHPSIHPPPPSEGVLLSVLASHDSL